LKGNEIEDQEPENQQQHVIFQPSVCHQISARAGGLYVHSVEKVMSSVVLRRCENA
jgi:hypothetical protein